MGELLAAHRGVDVRNVDDETLLRQASRFGFHAVAQALPAGAQVYARAKQTPLLQEALSGFVDVPEALLYVGAELDRANENDQTPLHHANYFGYHGLVEVLIVVNAH